MKRLGAVMLLAVVVLAGSPAAAQVGNTDSEQAAKRADIRRLLDLTGAGSSASR